MSSLWNCESLDIVDFDFISVVKVFVYMADLILCIYCRSKLYNYDDVVERLARHLNLDDPSKIRLTSHNCYSQQPKPQPIKYRGVEHLSDMLAHYNQVFYFAF